MPVPTDTSSFGPWPQRTARVIGWLKDSIRACGGKGSAGWFSPLTGWSQAYPETTGYLIPTLLDWSHRTRDEELKEMALGCAEWLLALQKPQGSFPGGLGEQGPPSVFNTAMIMEGLHAAALETGDERYRLALERAGDWLVSGMHPEGIWTEHLYVPNYSPAYHVRIGWVLYRMGDHWGLEEWSNAGLTVYAHHRPDILPTGSSWIEKASERPGQPVVLHFLAYVYDAALDLAIQFGDEDMVEAVRARLHALFQERGHHLRLPGEVDAQGRTDFRVRCPTGEAQVADALLRLHAHQGREEEKRLAGLILEGIHPCRFPLQGLRGGVMGSAPFWGPYQRLRCINWAAKFYLDAVGRLNGNSMSSRKS